MKIQQKKYFFGGWGPLGGGGGGGVVDRGVGLGGQGGCEWRRKVL